MALQAALHIQEHLFSVWLFLCVLMTSSLGGSLSYQSSFVIVIAFNRREHPDSRQKSVKRRNSQYECRKY